jgi:hypothetical protein
VISEKTKIIALLVHAPQELKLRKNNRELTICHIVYSDVHKNKPYLFLVIQATKKKFQLVY